jgi:drug/metabolite transporter (DMT)-like permease
MQNSRVGVALLLCFVATQAIRDVHLRYLFGNLRLFEVALIAFGTAAAVFGFGLLLLDRHQIKMLIAAWREVVAVNVTTVLAWVSYFGSLRLVEPAAVNLAFSGIAPVAVAVLGMFGLTSGGSDGMRRLETLLHWMLFATVALLAVIVSTGQSGFPRLDPAIGLAGVTLAAFAGVAITAESIISKRMNEAGISALSIVGVRFVLVTTVSAVMVVRAHGIHASLSVGAIATLSLIFLVILIGPIYLAQAGLKLTTPLLSSVILAIGPIATLALQSTAGGVTLSPAMLAVTALYAMISITAAVSSVRTRLTLRRRPPLSSLLNSE